jgi:ArsR family transcriptional regulator
MEMLEHRQADIIRALAHPVRLKIVRALAAGDRCVCQLIPELGLPQANVSQHLAVLRAAGIVDVERRGAYAYYALRYSEIADLLALLDTVVLKELEGSARTLNTLKEAK